MHRAQKLKLYPTSPGLTIFSRGMKLASCEGFERNQANHDSLNNSFNSIKTYLNTIKIFVRINDKYTLNS